MNEDFISIEFAEQLRTLSGLNQLNGIFFHVANEISSNKNPVFGAKLRKMGKIAGAPDYVFMWENGCGCIEMKYGKRPQSTSQIEFEAWCKEHSVKYEVCRSVASAFEVLEKWGFVKN